MRPQKNANQQQRHDRVKEVLNVIKTRLSFTNVEIAQVMGYRSDSYISDHMTGAKKASKLFIARLSEVFGVNQAYIESSEQPTFIDARKLDALKKSESYVPRETIIRTTNHKQPSPEPSEAEALKQAFQMLGDTLAMNRTLTAEMLSKKTEVTFETVSVGLQILLARIGLQCKLWKTEDEAFSDIRSSLFGGSSAEKLKNIRHDGHTTDKSWTK